MMKPTRSSNFPSVVVAARNLHKALTTRFKFVTDTTADSFDGIYVTAVFLNPAYRGVLNEQQLTKAKEFLKDHIDVVENLSEHPETSTEDADNNKETEPPVKRIKHLDRVSEFLQKKGTAREHTR